MHDFVQKLAYKRHEFFLYQPHTPMTISVYDPFRHPMFCSLSKEIYLNRESSPCINMLRIGLSHCWIGIRV